MTLQITLMQTTDLHGTLRGYDYLADKPVDTGGLSRVATLIRQCRNEQPNTLLFDCGDMLQGSVTCDLLARHELNQTGAHPVIAAMNSLHYDAAAPGNHDFDYGADFLFESISTAQFPFLCCNLHRTGSGLIPGPPAFAPHRILERCFRDLQGAMHRLRIGVTGCLPPQTLEWDHHLATEFHIRDMVSAVREEVAAMRKTGCDLIVILAHSGLEIGDRAGAENAILPLAALEGVDAVLGGHTHARFPGEAALPHPAINVETGLIHGTPVVMSGFWGSHLGAIDLTLERTAGAGWRVKQAAPRLVPTGTPPNTPPASEDPEILSITRPVHEATLARIHEPVGETRTPLHSFFSLFANDAALQLVARAQAGFLREAIHGTDLADLPLLSAAAPFKTGRRSGVDHYTHVPPGPLTRRSLADLYLYPNPFCALHVTGAVLRHWLEYSASLFARLDPDSAAPQPLLRDAFPGYKFDVICGVSYEIDISRPARFDDNGMLLDPEARRIRNLRWNGRRVTDTMEFIVATNAFRAHGIGFPPELGYHPTPEIVFESPVWTRDILRRYVTTHSPLDFEIQRNWSFTPLGGVRSLVATSPTARAYLHDPQLPPVEDLGDMPEGFMQLCLRI
ncbi:bifunctional 2',3'-cyclic-nucleotide 2'-phosphodiesterase/3'-nucleotidase [Aquicoccus porphyridii]|nr:bifunctional 2',3'-cyclic-nucleotide 2'-phosphodiesterase/3'-nucleotidase [Aquicoccus porphyridii]RAI55758.1 bifunctional 2',3'-cyclic-nucleotide 2'-phosphodiesterase/3'-nucleotidase [Rhodobacteraceae bacterium AsT-22]